jgi:hypothetical protein
MHVLNAAYDRLQNALPFIPEGARMPKMTVIETAINYIQDLLDMLEEADNEPVETPSDGDDSAAAVSTTRCQCSCHGRQQGTHYAY